MNESPLVFPDVASLQLAPHRKIYDAVHGFIRFNDLERELIDSVPFQRLHHLHQLGISFFVYPGATHTRFEHSLGTMELTDRIFNRLFLKEMQSCEAAYWRQVLRFAALCHDLGHLPFSHDAEQEIIGKGGHEQWTAAVIQSDFLQPIWERFQRVFPGRDVGLDVLKMAVGQEKLKSTGIVLSAWERALSEIITGDFFGTDRIDYLLRDAQCTGVSHGLFDYLQLIEMLCILPSLEGDGGLALGIEENGMESCEALLLARHFMHRRVYQYSSVQAPKFHLRRFMHQFYALGNYLSSLADYLSLSDNEILAAVGSAARDSRQPGHADALALMVRDKRFKAIDLGEIEEAKVRLLQQTLDIPSESMGWSLSGKKRSSKGLCFPVRMASGAIVDGFSCSEIVVPSKSSNWLFVDPEYEGIVREAFGS